jgi:hypothetical protein
LVALVGKWGAIAEIVHGLEASLGCDNPPFVHITEQERDRIEAKLEGLSC